MPAAPPSDRRGHESAFPRALPGSSTPACCAVARQRRPSSASRRCVPSETLVRPDGLPCPFVASYLRAMSRLGFLGLVVVSAAACGGAAAGSAPSSDVAVSVDATEVGARDVMPDVPSDEGVVDLGPVARWGTVSLVETHPEGPPVQQIVNAVFATSTLYGTPVATFGECGYYELPTRDALVAGAVTFTRGDAGYALAPEPVAPGISYPTEIARPGHKESGDRANTQAAHRLPPESDCTVWLSCRRAGGDRRVWCWLRSAAPSPLAPLAHIRSTDCHPAHHRKRCGYALRRHHRQWERRAPPAAAESAP